MKNTIAREQTLRILEDAQMHCETDDAFRSLKNSITHVWNINPELDDRHATWIEISEIEQTPD